MYLLIKDCETREEAIEKSGIYVGQPAKVRRIFASGNTDGVWTIIPRFELLEEPKRIIQGTDCNILERESEVENADSTK